MNKALHIGELIDLRLKELGMTAEELAQRVDLKPQQFQDQMRQAHYNVRFLHQLSQALRFNCFEFICQSQLPPWAQGKYPPQAVFTVELPIFSDQDFLHLIQFMQSYPSADQIIWPAYQGIARE